MTKLPPHVLVLGTGSESIRALEKIAGGGAGKRMVEIDEVDIPPTITGLHGRAWEVNRAAMLALHGPGAAGKDTSLLIWCIEAPFAHPLWHSYILAGVHLRPMPGMPPAEIMLPGATHEFWLWAANHEIPRAPFIKGEVKSPPVLTPMNFGAQVHASADEEFVALMRRTVQDICDAKLNPDTDATSQWVGRFGDAMLKKEFR